MRAGWFSCLGGRAGLQMRQQGGGKWVLSGDVVCVGGQAAERWR